MRVTFVLIIRVGYMVTLCVRDIEREYKVGKCG